MITLSLIIIITAIYINYKLRKIPSKNIFDFSFVNFLVFLISTTSSLAIIIVFVVYMIIKYAP